MISVVDAQREILLDPRGTNVWRYANLTVYVCGLCLIRIVVAKSPRA